MTLSLTKKMALRKGNPVEYIRTINTSLGPMLLFLIEQRNSYCGKPCQYTTTRYPCGRQELGEEVDYDVVNVPEKRFEYKNVYNDGEIGASWDSLTLANEACSAYIKRRLGVLTKLYEDDKLIDVTFTKDK